MKRLFVLLFSVFSTLSLWSQDSLAVWNNSSYNESRLKAQIGTLSPLPVWIEGTNAFYYAVYGADDKPTYYFVDAQKGKKELLFDADSMMPQLNALSKQSHEAKGYKLQNLSFKKGAVNVFYFTEKEQWYAYDRRTKKLEQSHNPSDEAVAKADDNTAQKKLDVKYYEELSPNEQFILYGVGHNIAYRNIKTGVDSVLTTDGELYHSYNITNRDVPADKKCRTLAKWIPNSSIICAFREDKRKVQEMSIIESLGDERPMAVTYKLELPGDKYVAQYDMTLFNVTTGKKIDVAISKYKDQVVEVKRIDENGVYFTRLARTLDTLDLCSVNPQNGQVRTLVSEIVHPHINNILQNVRFVNNGKNIIWWSERTGKGQYYLYDLNGRLVNRITQGDMVVGEIVSIDSLKNQIVFAGYGLDKKVNPEYKYFYMASLNGRKQHLLTSGHGMHDLTISPSGEFAIDTYSRVDQAPISQIIDLAKSQKPFVFHQTDIKPILALGWKYPTRICVKAADKKTDLYGVMYTPTKMDEQKKYPIITNVYPGPQSDQIPISFDLDDNNNQDLAELGYIVVNIGPRGSSPHRGKDFYCYSVGNIRDYPLADDKYGLEQLAAEYPFIDLSRVGIYGHSGGAFMTVSAMLTYPDFYKVAVAASGNYDNNIYTKEWGELYQGVQYKDGAFVSDSPTPMPLAKNLKGKLLLISGDVDKNVNISCTYRLIDAFVNADKMIDVMILPGMDHAVASPYYYKLIRRYFYTNLK